MFKGPGSVPRREMRMSIRFTAVKCPECGAELNIEEGRKQAYCTYCGTKILINNDNEHIYRTIDEAEIKKAEAEQIIRMRELDLLEKERAQAEKLRSQKVKVSAALAVAGTLMLCLSFMTGLGGAGGPESYVFMTVGLIMLLAIAFIWNVNRMK